MNENIESTLKVWNKEYKKGFLSFLVLLLIKERSMYGFEIISDLIKLTNGEMDFQESGVYQILKRLNERDFLKYEWQKSDKGPDRKYYTITKDGEELLFLFSRHYIFPIHNVLNDLLEKHFPEIVK